MQASIVLSTTSFVNGATIPYKFKNNSVCGQVNISPQFSWQYYGLIPAYVEYFNFYVEDTNVNGTSPNGKFLHWGIEKISSLQNYIAENGGWSGNNLTILSTDYLSGDNINGWNGPCVSSGIHTYNCWIEVKIYSEYYAYVFGSEYPIDGNGLIYSNILTFTDHLENLDPGLKTGSCNTYVCPLNYTLNDNLCYQYIVANAIRSPNTYQIRLVEGSPAFGAQGTRFYANADQTVGPLRGSIDSGAMGSTDAVLQDNDGTGVILSYTLDDSSALWKATDAFTGRLNILRVWTIPNVSNEWIGHSICLMVATTKKYCIGVGANTRMRIKINGNLFARFDRGDYPSHSGFWHVLEITLHQGINIIEIEGYSNGIAPALGFEIYEVEIAQLMALQTVMDLTASGYSTVKSSAFINSYFNIGSNSGYSCPQGFAYDVCTGNQCIDINYVNAQYISCCWRITNCDLETEEEYIISFSPNETSNLYLENIYALNGHPLLSNKCFILSERVICEMPEFQNITIIQDYGTNCALCRPSWLFQSCGDPSVILYLSFLDSSVPGTLIVDDIYKLNIDTICYKYIGINTDQMPDITNVSIVQHYDSTDCEVCRGCAVFIGCNRGIVIQVSFAPGQVLPTEEDDIDTLYILQGPTWNSTECWKFKGYSSPCFLPMADVIIVEHKDCTYCTNCTEYYKLTNCIDPEDIQYIFWRGSDPLDPSIAYVFNIGEPVCYMAELQFTPCDENLIVEPLYNDSNILEQYPEGCDKCNAVCYKIIDCGETIPIGATEQDMSGYVGYVIQWLDEQSQIHCSTVEPYICRLETYTMLTITVEGCYPTCEKCFPVVVPDPEFSINHRSVSPGYTTPECSTGSSCNSCSSNDPCTPCDNN